ncbi:hypothetical protein [Stratiformator vulcanicus]|uniref:Uncharacterized protein n=1 Tax=Stratiformator vulcanicus TaxID=2527980 RepID=A0A517R5L8_9PLAN|nr:hypothetical protein [Stratiformator vulcanicus]QDT39188.1 hypothetical protein Pan189_35910 [Stratiformator vulcanicus]
MAAAGTKAVCDRPQVVQNRFESLEVLHLAWEEYEETGEVPDPLPEPVEPSTACMEEFYGLPPLEPLPVSLNTYDLMRYVKEHGDITTQPDHPPL